MEKIYKGHEFEALITRFKDQVELLHRLTMIDLKIFTGFLTLQLLFGSWLALNKGKIGYGNPTFGSFNNGQEGLFIIDLTMAVLAVKILYNQYQRRKEAVGTVRNCNEALGYEEPGVYLDGKPLNAHTKTRFWLMWYVIGIAVSVIGIALVLFAERGGMPYRPSVLD